MICPQCSGKGRNRHSGYSCDSCRGKGEASFINTLMPFALFLASAFCFVMIGRFLWHLFAK
jgi:DnaJ-class molecular chaperone